MSLVARVSLTGEAEVDPEDYLFSSLSVIFPDDTTNQHGDADHGVLYTSPHLPEPITMSVTDPEGDSDRKLFSHFLWNASLMLAKLVEAGTLDAAERRGDSAIAGLRGSGPVPVTEADTVVSKYCSVSTEFDIAGQSTIELGAGTALPSIMSAILGAARVTITDYPSDVVMDNLKENIKRNVRIADSPRNEREKQEQQEKRNPVSTSEITVDGHAWGEFDTDVARTGYHAYDRVCVCDCLWMLWQHDNLRKSISWFLKDTDQDKERAARCWVIGGFHTGREKVAAFFDKEALAAENLDIEAIWERDCDDQERPWVEDRGVEDKTERKRWLTVAILRRKQ
ncbi:nicotinamide n-methyltransferase [Ophiostoma piceae UAMH 11346]|uniref:Nicotinamide n-methyltransferase n=1 Tax=Ophiostoma piceae (strain UAMH 11346) TaxID=1262450 RepID=S3C861_OPHP1|nr:nicotinamide n-methyltransferase [Ophiostoma piceae UAMH 11346]